MGIGKYIQEIVDQRQKTLASKAQAILPYIQVLQQKKMQDEQTGRMVETATNDALQRGKALGWSDDEINQFKTGITGIKDPGSVHQMFGDYDQRFQASRIVGDAPEGTDTGTLRRMAATALQEDEDRKQVETKAQSLGIDGYKTYKSLIAEGNDPNTAYGEASRRIEMSEYQAKHPPKSGGNGGGGEKPPKYSDVVKARVNTITGDDINKTKKNYVYWINQQGKPAKARVYKSANGKIYWYDTKEEVNLNDVLDVESVNPEDHIEIKKNPYAKAKGKKAAGTKPMTAEELNSYAEKP